MLEFELTVTSSTSVGDWKHYKFACESKNTVIQSGGEIYRIVNQLYDEPDFSKESIWFNNCRG